MLLHYKDKTKKTCGLLIKFNIDNSDEYGGREGHTHFAEHLMFAGTKKISGHDLFKKIDVYFDFLKAETRRESVEVICIFNIDDFDEVITLLKEMIFDWEIKKGHFAKEKKMIIDEAKDYYSLEKNKIFMRSLESIPIKNKKCPLGTIKQLEKISYKDLGKIKSFWQEKIKKSNKDCIAVGSAFKKEHLQKITRAFDIQKNNKELINNINIGKNFKDKTFTVWFKGNKYKHLLVFLYKIYYFRWLDKYNQKIDLYPNTVEDVWLCSLYGPGISNQKIKQISEEIFFKTPTKKEFDFVKKIFINRLYQIFDTVDLVDSLYFLDQEYILSDKNGVIDPKKNINFYKGIKFTEFKTFFKTIHAS